MPLQNRVDPFGGIRAVAARGLFTGNRGVIHDPEARTLLKRRWTTKAWIICLCEFRGRRRAVMGRNAPSGKAGWTELFFLDEVTALAAGHRPCFYCRREAAARFAAAFSQGRDGGKMSAPAIDAILHGERLASAGHPAPASPSPETLPDGAMVAVDGRPYALRSGMVRPWHAEGYGPPFPLPELPAGDLCLVTPRSTVAALRAGYLPTWHPSADLP